MDQAAFHHREYKQQEVVMTDRMVSIEQAVEDIRNGKMVILVDDEDRENEGDLCCAAELVTPEIINFMATHARGLICLSLTGEKLDSLGLNPMVKENQSQYETAFTKSIDAAQGITTGISAQDRAHTILTAVDNNAQPDDLACPGHTFPLRARRGGVLTRPGQTEGSVDLSRLAGLRPAGVICEIMNDDGTMARLPELIEFGEKFGINIVSVAALIQYRLIHETLVYQLAEKKHLPRQEGELRLVTYGSDLTPEISYIAMIKGDISQDDQVLVRIHKECFLGDFVNSSLCDCSRKLRHSKEIITNEGKGILLYLRRKDGLFDFEHHAGGCTAAQDNPDESKNQKDVVKQQELFHCGICAKILLDIGIDQIRPIISRPSYEINFETYGLKLAESVKI